MPLKVLVVDDSALMRKHLTTLLKAEGFEVQIARTGREALTELSFFKPDVVTLDINMPEMDGLTALAHIMTERPTPTVMVSSLTERGALATLEALALGAVDYIAKPGGTISLSIDAISSSIVQKVRAASEARIRGRSGRGDRYRAAAPAPAPISASASAAASARASLVKDATPRKRSYPASGSPFGLVLIGVSTGGPRTLEEVLPFLPANLPWPVLVAQHMPPSFTASLASRLNGLCPLEVREGVSMEELRPGNIYIARGGTDMVVAQRGSKLVIVNRPESPGHTWHPSVELLVQSAAELVPAEKIIAVQLTGMGHDGAQAMTDLRKAGGRTIAESDETAVIFGMPAELIKRGGAECVLPSGKIAQQIRQWIGRAS
ncbi:chemotaxis-specific protein-glutamate methyltransferase CheB [Rhizobium sp. 9140]|uniref:chemotaxis-specific protein-glutamate methyltransferase CheB n=1 Tax=Rhizobium sp. 9140 TaxID=1761900 RepID=UPI00079B066C|nr:chemotaxis-specific protein-glutamate methyltransferase CheB [Rhizobium sp. 9140]CZT36450.1 two-component system, chemotaxis family, response regulator CheB [Rhizobium sp. 9140]